MKTSEKGLNLIKSFEGLYLTAYRCPAGVPTIGWGHTKGVKMGMNITKEQAEQYLRADLATCEKKVEEWNPTYRWTQGEFDAIVSFLFNLGSGKMKDLVQSGRRTKAEIAEAFLLYTKARNTKTGKLEVLSGLKRRREAERALFLGGATNNTPKADPVLKMGSKGAEVKLAQTYLRDAGYEVGAIDGVFGKKTDAAVRKFQSDNIDICKSIDGVIGTKTWKALKQKAKS
jgi:GH24 family phage-related lysozyme (muramidase)